MVAISSDRDTAEMSKVLDCFPLPDQLIATRPSNSAEWQRGASRDPLHAQWLMASMDEFKREIVSILDHDVLIVEASNLRLSDPRLGRDALTRRVFALAVTNRITQNYFDKRALFSLLNSLDTLTRWRLSLGVSCVADLTAQDFEAFLRRLGNSTSVADMVRISPTIPELGEIRRERSKTTFPEDGWDHDEFATDGLAAYSDVKPEAFSCSSDTIDPPSRQGRTVTGRRLSVRRVQQFLRAWLVLADLSSRNLLSHDPLTFAPFGTGEDSISRIAERTGEEGFRLAIAPPYFLSLLDASARWVLDYAPHVLDAYLTMRDDPFLNATGGNEARRKAARRRELSLAFDSKLPAGMPRLALTWRLDEAIAIGGGMRMSMMQAVTHLMTACMVLVAGFGARSVSDALKLQVDCLKEAAPGRWELSLRLGDDVRDLDAMPVPDIVSLAVNVMKSLTEDTRAYTGDDRLFFFIRRASAIRQGSKSRNLSLGFPKLRWLKDFAAVNGLPEVDPETHAELTGDQLRLGFAVTYHFVFPTLPLEALTRALGMFSTSDALDYVERSLPGAAARLADTIRAREKTHRAVAGETAINDLRDLLRDLKLRMDGCESLRCEAAFRLIRGVVNGTDLPTGAGGEQLVVTMRELVEGARRRVRVLGLNHPDAADYAVEEALRRYVRHNRLDLVPGGHTHCRSKPGSTDDPAKALCAVAAAEAVPWERVPHTVMGNCPRDFAYSGMVRCVGCERGARFGVDQAVVDTECTRLANGGGPAETVAAQAARVVRLEELLAEYTTQVRSGLAP